MGQDARRAIALACSLRMRYVPDPTVPEAQDRDLDGFHPMPLSHSPAPGILREEASTDQGADTRLARDGAARYTSRMPEEQQNNPLHGVTLEAILRLLVERYGWEGLAERIPVRCFSSDPSVKSSLTFLRRTPWARAKVEALYLGKLRPRRKGRGGKPGAGPGKRPAEKPAGPPET